MIPVYNVPQSVNRNSKKEKSVNRPYARRGDLNQVPVRIAKVEAGASLFPRALLLHGNPVFREPIFPAGQLRSRDGKREMELAVAVVRRGNGSRAALLE